MSGRTAFWAEVLGRTVSLDTSRLAPEALAVETQALSELLDAGVPFNVARARAEWVTEAHLAVLSQQVAA